MILGLLLFQALAWVSGPVALAFTVPAKPPFTRSAEPFRSPVETKFLLSEYGAVVKERRPNRWEKLALALAKSGHLEQ